MALGHKPVAASLIKHIALLHWGDLIEDFLAPLNISLEAFRNEMTGGWMFGYLEALQTAGVQTTLICVSARVRKVEYWRHGPTKAAICVLPASRLYTWLRQLGVDAEIWKGATKMRYSSLLWFPRRILRALLPYFATPFFRLLREIRGGEYQAILCQEYEHARFDFCLAIGKLCGIKVFATFQGGNAAFTRLERISRPLIVKRADGLIIGSSKERDRVKSSYGLPSFKVASIFNPLDLSIWYPEHRLSVRRLLGLPEKALIAVWHGRIDLHRKGLDVLVEAWNRILHGSPNLDVYLLLIGTGPDKSLLRNMLETKCSHRVIWKDEYILDRHLLRKYLSAGDVYAFPSRHEGFPVAPLEAMACFLPVVASDCDGVGDIFSSDSNGGVTVPPGDPEQFADKLRMLLTNNDTRVRMGQQARMHIERAFSLHVVGGQLYNFLATASSESSPAMSSEM